MKIELKNLKINLSFSEETTMFKADIYVDGVKCGYAENDGHGGCTNYGSYEGKRELLKQAEAYALTLPSTKHTFGDTTITLKSNLEHMIDQMVDDEAQAKENAKFEKKKQKLMANHFVWGVPNSGAFTKLAYKGKPMFVDVMKTPQGKEVIKNMIFKIKKEYLKEGEVLFNKF